MEIVTKVCDPCRKDYHKIRTRHCDIVVDKNGIRKIVAFRKESHRRPLVANIECWEESFSHMHKVWPSKMDKEDTLPLDDKYASSLDAHTAVVAGCKGNYN